MNKTLYTLAATLLLFACSEPREANQAAPNEGETQSPTAAMAMTNSGGHYFHKQEGKNMAVNFRTAVQNGTLDTNNVPRSLMIEKKHIEFLLDALGENTGGILFYPAIDPTSNKMSLILTPAVFDVNAEGEYENGDISALYPIVNGNPSVLQHLMLCPTNCTLATSDLYNQ